MSDLPRHGEIPAEIEHGLTLAIFQRTLARDYLAGTPLRITNLMCR
jgi:hypothetical protein